MIKKFDEFINESKLPQFPEIGDMVKGVDDNKYEILDFCKVEDISAVNTLLRKYDTTGAMKEEIVDNKPTDGTILVALEDKNKNTSVWYWNDTWLKM